MTDQSDISILKLLDESPIGVAILDQATGKRLYANPALARIFGVETKDDLLKSDIENTWVNPDHLARAFKVFSSGQILSNFEAERKRVDGSTWWVLMNSQPIEFQGKQAGIVWHTDITARKQIEQQLQAAKEEAESASKAKSDFLAAMSHDLRTPLNAIMGFSDMIRTQAFGPIGTPSYEEYANDIHHSGSLLVSLINDVLDLSKVEAGKYELFEEHLDIRSLIETSFKQLGHMARTSGHVLSSDVACDVPSLLGDERVMTQILNNLLSNAIKFTHDGGTIHVAAKVDKSNRIVLAVSDTGIGMTDEDILNVLNPFEQAATDRARKYKGTGLGLHLCANFMELFGGSMSIESEVDKGTTMMLKFPPDRTVPAP